MILDIMGGSYLSQNIAALGLEEAHARMEAGDHIGKIVLRVD